ncbi:MAG: Crp/Fnr family transcriptional regulator [Rhodobacterales bacterium]|nr:Crp/Fnr family transcriptional regulator [Rhodobacterales bacterium]
MRDILAEHFLLKGLPPDDLDRLAALSHTRAYTANQNIFSKGDPATGMMGVISGRVRIVAYSADGKEVVLRVIEPGEVFGEIALIDGGERTADAIAMGRCDLLVLERRDFLPVLETNPALCLKLLRMMCQRLRSTSEQLEDFSFLDLRTRLAKRLLRLAGQHGEKAPDGVRIGLNLSQQMLGAMMGTTREAVNKQLRALEDEGLVRLGRGSVTVLDRAALEAIVEAAE